MTDFPPFDDKISENLKKASQTCYENGADLLVDANILYDRERYARAVSLAILAEEELSKALILQLSSNNGRWDKDLYEALLMHEKKQAISSAMTEIMDAFAQHLTRAKFLFLPTSFNVERQTKIEAEKAKKECIDKQKRDRRKQDAQFVAIGRTGIACRTPKSFTKQDAAVEIDRAVRFRAYLDALYAKLGDDYPLFRGVTTITHCGGIIIINHKSGITIRLKPFDWAKTGCEPDNVTMNPHIILPELKTLDPNRLNKEEKIKLARIYKSYDAPGQVRKEMVKLGLRSTDYLDEIEGLIELYAK